jgi:hypothetical protein
MLLSKKGFAGGVDLCLFLFKEYGLLFLNRAGADHGILLFGYNI